MRSVAFCITIMILSESLLKTMRQGTPEEFGVGSICLNTVYVPEACYSVGSPWRYTGFSCKLFLFYGQQWNCARPREACLYNPHFPRQDLSCKYKRLWSLLWRCSGPSWTPTDVTYCGVPALVGGLGSVISWGPLQTLQFCDSMMHIVLPWWKNIEQFAPSTLVHPFLPTWLPSSLPSFFLPSCLLFTSVITFIFFYSFLFSFLHRDQLNSLRPEVVEIC